MIESLHRRRWHYLLLTAVSSLAFFLNLGGATLWDVDEGRNATCALEMYASGRWVVPTFNAQLRIDKPILLYWLQIFAYGAFGVNEFAARFPSAFAAFLTMLCAYELGRSMFTRTTGLITGLVVATTPMLCGAARFANPDSLLNLFTVMTLTIYWLGLAERRWWWFPLLGATSGLAMLAKGPVGFVLPAGVITLFALWERHGRMFWDWRWLWTFAAFYLVALPWYILVGVETKGEFLKGFFLKHNLERGLEPMQDHRGFPGYYVVIVLVGMGLWSIFLPAAIWFGGWGAIRAPWHRVQNWWAGAANPGSAAGNGGICDEAAAYRLLLCWIATYLICFSTAATKLPNYVLPVVVPVGLLIGRFVERWSADRLTLPGWLVGMALASLFLIGAVLSIGLAIAGGIGEFALVRGRFVPGLQLWALIGLVPIAAAAGGIHFARTRRHGHFMLGFGLAALLLISPFAAFGSVTFNDRKAPCRLVQDTGALRLDEDIRIGGWQARHMPSLNFYVQRDVEHIDEEHALAEFLRGSLPVYLFMPLREWQRLEASLSPYGRVAGNRYDMYSNAEFVVVTNRRGR